MSGFLRSNPNANASRSHCRAKTRPVSVLADLGAWLQI